MKKLRCISTGPRPDDSAGPEAFFGMSLSELATVLNVNIAMHASLCAAGALARSLETFEQQWLTDWRFRRALYFLLLQGSLSDKIPEPEKRAVH